MLLIILPQQYNLFILAINSSEICLRQLLLPWLTRNPVNLFGHPMHLPSKGFLLVYVILVRNHYIDRRDVVFCWHIEYACSP